MQIDLTVRISLNQTDRHAIFVLVPHTPPGNATRERPTSRARPLRSGLATQRAIHSAVHDPRCSHQKPITKPVDRRSEDSECVFEDCATSAHFVDEVLIAERETETLDGVIRHPVEVALEQAGFRLSSRPGGPGGQELVSWPGQREFLTIWVRQTDLDGNE